MRLLFVKFVQVFICVIALESCDQMPAEVRVQQLRAVPYYKEELRGDVKHKVELYYKPYIYNYAGKPYTGYVKDITAKEDLLSEGPMKDGFQHGHWVYYNENGSIKSEGSYINGVRDSIWRSNYRDGVPKIVERFFLKNEALRSDTTDAWYYSGQKLIETSGDTTRRYYENGRLMSKTIKGTSKLQEVYMTDGLLVFRSDKYKKDVFFSGGKLRTRTYYLNDNASTGKLYSEKRNWTKEERDAIKNADSVLFDYSNYWDPVIKIYVKE